MDFLNSLFDFSFDRFITTKIIKILYAILIALAALGALGTIVAGFGDSVGLGVLMLLLSPIFFVISVIIGRVYLELLIVIFRIAENVTEIAKKNKPTY